MVKCKLCLIEIDEQFFSQVLVNVFIYFWSDVFKKCIIGLEDTTNFKQLQFIVTCSTEVDTDYFGVGGRKKKTNNKVWIAFQTEDINNCCKAEFIILAHVDVFL